MKIISLQAENFKKLHAIEITPDGNFVQITGRNGQGKSSTLDAIWVALAGIGVAPKQPIRKGAESARIRLDLGEIKVTRHFKATEDGAYTTSLTVESAEGARYPSPQKLLDSLLGAMSFDPLAFSRMDAKAQFDALRKFVPDIDFDAIDRAQLGDYQKRTDVNRRLKDAKASADNIRVTDKPPCEPIDESALVVKLKEAGEHNTDIERRKVNREKFTARIAELREINATANARFEEFATRHQSACDTRVNELIEEMERLKARIELVQSTTKEEMLQRSREIAVEAVNALDEATALQAKLDAAGPLPDIIDAAQVAAELNTARTNNQRHAEWAADTKKRTDLRALAKILETESVALTKQMDQRLKDKQAAIAAAQLPIHGISFGEGAVLLNDVPFDQSSDAEKLRASVEMAMAANPKLRVVRIRDGSLLDEDGLRLVAEMADARDCQVWLERVDGSGKVGIVLENGQIKAHEDAT